ncbi:hypothetical protein F4819DRAFT_473258 [Hypoxylon fuscum]|nr:hypothetical protein F4819DRAFT_473258 [Hypoxylon fuscum]
MVSGFSIVLWSRLHLLASTYPRVLLRIVFAMIVVDGVLFHPPIIVFQFLSLNAPTHAKIPPYMDVTEHIQVMAFLVQETIISAIYVWGTLQLLKQSPNTKAKNTMAFLIIVQIIVVLADVLVIVLDYLEYLMFKPILQSFVYAFKLQVEFVVLNEFKFIAKGGITGASGSLGARPCLFASFNNKELLDMPKTSGSPVHNNSGVTMVVSGGASPPSSSATQPDVPTGQNEHLEEPDDIEAQYLGRYGRDL